MNITKREDLPDTCDKGYKGECCCNCEHQREIRVCNCGSCSNVTGYICLANEFMDGFKRYECTHHDFEHSVCETWDMRTDKF